MFKYKTEEELGKMTTDQRDIYAEQKRAFESEGTKKMIADAIKERFPTRLQELKADPANAAKTEVELNAMVKAEQETEIDAAKNRKAEFDALKQDVQEIKERTIIGAVKTSIISTEVKTHKEALSKMIKGQGGDVELKAVTARASINTNPNQMLIPGIGQLIRIARSLYDIFRKVNLPIGSHNGTIKYLDWDETTTAKAAAAIAEAGTFPESTAAFKGYSVELKKVGDTLPVNEEFFEDEANAAAELEMFLENNVNSKIDNGIVNADGTGDNITGLLASINSYTLPSSGSVVDPNIYDLITTVKAAITKPAGNKYKPDFAAMNLDTINRLLLKKDANNNYQFPPNHPIFGMIVEDNSIADNVLVVGDKRYATIYEMGGVTLSRGIVNTQFVKDQLTLKARQRLLFLIKNSDKSGFRKVLDIDAALLALKTV